MPLPMRKIGQDDVSAMGFGLMSLSLNFNDDEERFKVLDAAVELGCTNWDTSDAYGDSEDLIGKWFKRTGKRDEIFLATKFGHTRTGFCGTPEYVRTAITRSLERLGVDMVDLYYVHRVDKTVPIELTVRALAELVKEGKIRYIGLSEASSATIRRAHAVHPIAAVQVEYSPFFLDIEDEKNGVLKTCRELGIAIVAYSPNGRGMLAGRFKSYDDIPDGDVRKMTPRFGPDNFPHIMKIVKGFEVLGAKHNATPAQVCLAWLLSQGNDIIPIPGTKQIKFLKENIDTLKVTLSNEDLAAIRDIVVKADANHGDRYHNAALMNLCFADTPELVE